MGALRLYFFDIRHDDQFIEDFEGQEFASLKAVRAEAIAAARDILASDVKSGGATKFRVEVTDASGETVLMVNAKAQINLSSARASKQSGGDGRQTLPAAQTAGARA